MNRDRKKLLFAGGVLESVELPNGRVQPLRPMYMSEEEKQRRINSNPDNEYDGL